LSKVKKTIKKKPILGTIADFRKKKKGRRQRSVKGKKEKKARTLGKKKPSPGAKYKSEVLPCLRKKKEKFRERGKGAVGTKRKAEKRDLWGKTGWGKRSCEREGKGSTNASGGGERFPFWEKKVSGGGNMEKRPTEFLQLKAT